jgi:hypothetical protein
MTSVFERVKTVHGFDRAAAVIGPSTSDMIRPVSGQIETGEVWLAGFGDRLRLAESDERNTVMKMM